MSTSFSVSSSGSESGPSHGSRGPTDGATPNPDAPLKVDGLSVQIAGTPILTNLNLTVAPGQRIGLIGENGSGKSTLLHAIHGSLPPAATTAGVIEVGTSAHPARVGLLHQQAPFAAEDTISQALESAVAAEDTISQALESAVAAERQVAKNLEAAADPYDEQAYTKAIDLAERLDIWETDSRISTTLAGLGLSHIQTDRPAGALSGGQRSRLSLAWLLLNRPDVPTARRAHQPPRRSRHGLPGQRPERVEGSGAVRQSRPCVPGHRGVRHRRPGSRADDGRRGRRADPLHRQLHRLPCRP